MNNSTPSQQDLSKLPHKLQVMFAVFCAEQVFHLVREEDKLLCRAAVDTAKSWVFGEGATVEDCKKAADAAYAAARADYAAYAAAHAAYAAYADYYAVNAAYVAANTTAYVAYAATTKNKEQVIEEQWNYYNELLSLDEIVEKNLIG